MSNDKQVKEELLKRVGKILYFIIALNISDILFTLVLHQTGLFIEINPIMLKTLDNPMLSMCIKTFIPVALVYYTIQRLRQATEPQLNRCIKWFSVLGWFYATVNVMHLVNICILFILRLTRKI